jgi:hypothetical protein
MATLAKSSAASAHTHAGSVYGLRFRSVVPLPPVALGVDGEADAAVRWADLGHVTRDLLAGELPASVTGEETGLAFPGIGTFLVRHGREILVDPEPDAGEALLQLVLLGPVLAALLQQRGQLILHASAVEIAGAAVGFLGGRGAGKSTLAAALYSRGHALLTDDILAVALQNGSPGVLPGLAQLKLWPDAVTALGGDPVILPPVREGHEKRAQDASARFRSAPLPLARLYVLSGGDAPGIEPLTARDAFLDVVTHSYGITWLHGVSGSGEFEARAELVRRVPVRRLRRPAGLDLLGQVARLVEEDLEIR